MPYHRKTTPQFVEEAQRVHGEKFDYSEVEYANTHTPVKIKCRQCGVVFMQEPASHPDALSAVPSAAEED